MDFDEYRQRGTWVQMIFNQRRRVRFTVRQERRVCLLHQSELTLMLRRARRHLEKGILCLEIREIYNTPGHHPDE